MKRLGKLFNTHKTHVSFLFTAFLSAGASAVDVAELDNSVMDIVPAGYVVTDAVFGDLNNDDTDDVVLMIKGTDQSNFVNDEYRGELNQNRRGIIVAFRNDEEFNVVVENRDCFFSDHGDGGVYFLPEIGFTIENGKLFIDFFHGRYGYWQYNFRHQGADFELIGYDSSSNRGPVVERVTSINYLTKKKLVQDNINYEDDLDPIFEDTWSTFNLESRFKLSEIEDFSEFGDGLP